MLIDRPGCRPWARGRRHRARRRRRSRTRVHAAIGVRVRDLPDHAGADPRRRRGALTRYRTSAYRLVRQIGDSSSAAERGCFSTRRQRDTPIGKVVVVWPQSMTSLPARRGRYAALPCRLPRATELSRRFSARSGSGCRGRIRRVFRSGDRTAARARQCSTTSTGWFVQASTGESSARTAQERRTLLRVAAAQIRPRPGSATVPWRQLGRVPLPALRRRIGS